MLKKFALIIITSALLFYACNTDNVCNENTITRLKLGFYCRYFSGDRYLIKDSAISISELYGMGGSILIKDTTINTNKLYLPLSENSDSSAFSIALKDYTDIITVKYKRKRVFINYDCGFRTDYQIDTIMSFDHHFDSIHINTPLVTDADEEHIKIFYNRPVK